MKKGWTIWPLPSGKKNKHWHSSIMKKWSSLRKPNDLLRISLSPWDNSTGVASNPMPPMKKTSAFPKYKNSTSNKRNWPPPLIYSEKIIRSWPIRSLPIFKQMRKNYSHPLNPTKTTSSRISLPSKQKLRMHKLSHPHRKIMNLDLTPTFKTIKPRCFNLEIKWLLNWDKPQHQS